IYTVRFGPVLPLCFAARDCEQKSVYSVLPAGGCALPNADSQCAVLPVARATLPQMPVSDPIGTRVHCSCFQVRGAVPAALPLAPEFPRAIPAACAGSARY